MAQQYIFQMQGLTKAYPGGKKVFENIWLSFYSDAKIGVGMEPSLVTQLWPQPKRANGFILLNCGARLRLKSFLNR